jgi:hypothetical protein
MIEEPQNLPDDSDEPGVPGPQMPLGIVITRITVVTCMSFAGAAAIFFLVGALWLYALASLAATVVFVAAMFLVEKFAERDEHTERGGA